MISEEEVDMRGGLCRVSPNASRRTARHDRAPEPVVAPILRSRLAVVEPQGVRSHPITSKEPLNRATPSSPFTRRGPVTCWTRTSSCKRSHWRRQRLGGHTAQPAPARLDFPPRDTPRPRGFRTREPPGSAAQPPLQVCALDRSQALASAPPTPAATEHPRASTRHSFPRGRGDEHAERDTWVS